MILRDIILRYGRRTPTVYAALCTAAAGELLVRYPEGERYEVLVMIRCADCDAERVVGALLESHGWRDVIIEEIEQLNPSFTTSDREVRACYVSAMTSDGGLLVYDDPIEKGARGRSPQH